MIRRFVIVGGLALASSLVVAPTKAERLVTSLSTHRVQITSSFTGAELVLFGSVERDGATAARRGDYDVVVTVTGPRQTVMTFRKERVVGIWMNTDSRTFLNAPSYLAVLANSPISTIADPNALRGGRTGLEQVLLPQQVGGDVADVVREDPFRQAFLRIKLDRKLYREQHNAVTFLTPTLFRTTIPLPDNVPTGSYEVDVKLFADGVMLAHQTSALEIVKVGFEQFVANAAHDYGLFYGLATAMMAVLTGWLAAFAFARD